MIGFRQCLATLGVVGLLLGGCGGADDGPTFGDWSLAADSLRLTETLRVSETDEFYFGAVTALDVTSGGRMVVADGEASHIKVLAPDGTLLDTLGGPGGGPGEFESLSSVQAARGDSLYAYDIQTSRLTVFGPAPSHEVERTVRLPREEGFAVYVRVLGEALVGGFGALSYPEEGISRSAPLTWRRLSETGIPRDTLLRTRRSRVATWSIEGGIRVEEIPFDRSTSFAVGPDGRLYHGWTDSLTVRAHAPTGETEMIADVPAPPLPVTESARDSALREVNTELRSMVASALPETKPAFTDLLVSDDGRLWIRRPPEDPGAETTDWWILAPETKTIRPARLPRTVDLEVVRDGAAYGTTTTEVGAPAVVRYRIDTP
jgi:hypothetical protein